MTETVETIKLHGITAEIIPDYDAEYANPRENDNLGTMACWHRNYILGDVQPKQTPEEYLAELAELTGEKPLISLPLYLIDHSGISMRTHDFSDCDPGAWDSGQVGFIFVTPSRIRAQFNVKRITKRVREQATDVLRGEVEEYDRFIRGEVYGYRIVDADGQELDSCWGFLGFDYIKQHVTEQLAYYAAKAQAMDTPEDAH